MYDAKQPLPSNQNHLHERNANGLVMFGWIGDHTKTRQLPFLLGLIILGGATLLFSLTTSLPLIVLARILQGFSTAIVFTIGFSLMLDSVGNERIGHAVGFTSMSLSMGLLGGPIVGGFIYDSAGYFAVFIPAFVLIAVEIILRLLLRPISRASIDLGSQNDSAAPEERRPLISNPEASAPQTSVQESWNSEEPNPEPANLETLNPEVSSLVALLQSPRFVVAMIGMAMINTFLTAFEAVLPVYLHQVFGYNPGQISIVFLCNTLPMLLSPVTGRAVDKVGPFWPAIAGFSLAAPSMMLLSLVQRRTLVSSLLLRIFFFLFGCGVSMAMPAMMAEVSISTEVVESQRPGIFGAKGAYSQAYGLSNAAFAVGTLAGPLYASFIKEYAGWTAMCMSLGGLSVLMILLAIVFTGRSEADLRNTPG